MRSRWPLLAILCALASLLVPGIASASTAAGAETRVWAFDLQDQVGVGVERSLTLGLHRGCAPTYDQIASDSLLASRGAKRGPKTDPTAPHNATIRVEADALEAGGNTIVAGGGRAKERLIPTPGGKMTGRRPDILYETPDGTVRGRNVGRTRADGSPVKREVEALDDLNGPGGVPTDFVPYDR